MQRPCPTALPNGLTYLTFPSYSGSLSAPGGGAEGPGVRSLVQQLLDEGCVLGTAPFVPLKQAHTCLCAQTVSLGLGACGQRCLWRTRWAQVGTALAPRYWNKASIQASLRGFKP